MSLFGGGAEPWREPKPVRKFTDSLASDGADVTALDLPSPFFTET